MAPFPCRFMGSATSCVSKALKVSHVLSAIGLEHSLGQANIILSLGKDNTDEDVDYFLATFPKIIARLRDMSPMWDEFKKGMVPSAIRKQ